MAKQTLRPQLKRFFDLLTQHNAGDILTEQEVLIATGWKPETFGTHKRKHKLDRFLTESAPGEFRTVQDGSKINTTDIWNAFTQISPGILVLTKGMTVSGEGNEYRLDREIGRGAVAHVWRGTSPDGNRFAIKIMNPRPDLLEPTRLENVRARFRRESRNGLRLEHPNVVRYRDSGEVNGHPFIVMDLADKSLFQILQTGPLDDPEALVAIAQCLDGLKYLHQEGCIHRDIKPENILQFGDRFALGDLGIVKWSDMNPAFTSAGTLTRASVQLGSWYYMAPEQRRAPHEAVQASDVYALGITWYHALTGNTPDPAEVGAKAYDRPSARKDVNALIARMLDFAANRRPKLSVLCSEVARIAEAASNPENESQDPQTSLDFYGSERPEDS